MTFCARPLKGMLATGHHHATQEICPKLYYNYKQSAIQQDECVKAYHSRINSSRQRLTCRLADPQMLGSTIDPVVLEPMQVQSTPKAGRSIRVLRI